MALTVFIRLAGRDDCDQPAPFFISTNAEWSAVQHLLASYYGEVCPDDLDVRYWDEEDYVILSSQEELEEAIRLTEDQEYLQLYVRLMDQGDSNWPTEHLDVSSEKRMREETVEEASNRSEPRENSSDHTPAHSQPQELLSAETPQCDSATSASQQNKASTPDKREDKPEDETLHRRAPEAIAMEDPTDSSSSEKAHVLDYLLKNRSTASNTVPKPNRVMDAEMAKGHQHKLDVGAFASPQEMMAEAGDVSFDEGHILEEDSDELELNDLERTMLPGALSGANVIAIEMPEMEHQGTETAEPAEIAETGEVSTKSSRDAETGFWMQPELEAGVKAELRRKLSALVTGKERASYELQQRKMEHTSSRQGSSQKKKKYHGEVGGSHSSLDTGGVLEPLSEEASGDSPPPLPRRQERRSGKSEGKKKKHHSDLLTEDAFIRFMTKFESQLKKDMAKEVAKKTVRSVAKTLVRQVEGDTATSPPAASSKTSGNVHEDIICDCCDRKIVGTRYICGNCPNYDLCEECEDIQPSFHDDGHVFIKLRRPCQKAGTHHGVRAPLLKHVIYETKEEERKRNPEWMQMIMECTKVQVGQMERRMSRNNNGEEREEQDLTDEQKQHQQEEEEVKQAAEMLERAFGGKVTEDTSSQDSGRISPSQLMEVFWPSWKEDVKSELQISIVHGQPAEAVRQTANPDLCSSSVDDGSGAGNCIQLQNGVNGSGGCAESSLPSLLKKDSLRGDEDDLPKGDFDYEAFAAEYELIGPGGREREEDDDVVPFFVECGFDMCPTAQSCNMEQTAQDKEGESQTEAHVDTGARLSASTRPTTTITTSVSTSTLCADPDCGTHHGDRCDDMDAIGTEKPPSSCSDQEEGKYCDCCYCEFFRNGMVPVSEPTKNYTAMRERLREQLMNRQSYRREMSPASIIETDNLLTPQTEMEEMSQEPQVADKLSDDKADCQQKEADETSSFGSLSDESSGEEDFVVIVPDCFDISKPLNPDSLARLAEEKEGKQRSHSTKQGDEPSSDTKPAEQGPDANIPAAVENHRPAETAAGERSHDLYYLSCAAPGTKGTGLSRRLPQAERSDDSGNEEDEDNQKEQSVGVPHCNTRELEEEDSAEKADVQEEESISEQGDIPPTTQASGNEASTAEDHAPEREEPTDREQNSETLNLAVGSNREDPEDCGGSDVDETDLKCPPESDEEGAIAAADGVWDPNQQLSQMMTNTLKKAGSGLQHVFQTGKDIFKTLQRGDSYEYKTSTYVYKPSDFKLPESTWQPTSSEYTPPKSNFTPIKSEYQVPKSTYKGPQAVVPAGLGAGGEFFVPLQRIREMGYFNNQRTLALLRKHEGDVQKVVDELLDETDNEWAEQRHGNAS